MQSAMNDPKVLAAIRDYLSRSFQGEIIDVATRAKHASTEELLKLCEDIVRNKVPTRHKEEVDPETKDTRKNDMREEARCIALTALAQVQSPVAKELLSEFFANPRWQFRAAALETAFWLKSQDAAHLKSAADFLVELKSINTDAEEKLSLDERDGVRNSRVWALALLAGDPAQRSDRVTGLIQLFRNPATESETRLTCGLAISALPDSKELTAQITRLLNPGRNPELALDIHCVLMKFKTQSYTHKFQVDLLLKEDKSSSLKSRLLSWCFLIPQVRAEKKAFLTETARSDLSTINRWTAELALRKLATDPKSK